MIIIQKILARRAQSVIKAFTLVETLLVLSITTFIILLFAGSLTRVVHVMRGELFVATFENDLKNTQFLAAATHQPQSIAASSDRLTYGSVSLAIPPEVQPANFSVTFDARGNNTSLSKIKLSLPYEGRTISYQLEMGSGKYKKTIK